ncbi:MAG: DNA polymerase II large subunit, partial [Thermoplasmata archaeon]
PYVELYFAGPIRAAGGTAQALSVLLADIIRRDLGLAAYRPTREEIGRYQEEIPLYKHFQHLQYTPTPEEIATVVQRAGVCITGEATEGDAEVSAFRNLPRVPTNGLRGGACLVVAEGLCQKAGKLRRIVEKLGVPGWEFLAELGHSREGEETASVPKYLADAGVGGRPILAHPSRPGGLRLVYGRCRTSGLAACAVNPATMVLLRRFVAIGTQLKIEYPGKAAAMGLCDLVDGPMVELDDGTFLAVHDRRQAEALLPRVRRIVDLGEILVAYGEFLENNHPLVPGAYSLDWHREELGRAGVPRDADDGGRDFSRALALAREHDVPLHPRWLFFWHDLTSAEIRALSEHVEREGSLSPDGSLRLPWDDAWREMLQRLGVPHRPGPEGSLLVAAADAVPLAATLGLVPDAGALRRAAPLDPVDPEPLGYASRLLGARVMARGPSRIGARVGRPEKAHQRTMEPNVHALFPVGEAGGPSRSVAEAARRTEGSDGVVVPLGLRRCPSCGKSSVWARCACGAHTVPTGTSAPLALPVGSIWRDALGRLRLLSPPAVKGVKGLTSAARIPEPIEKGILRAQHGVSVYQDGTARFDMMDLPLTHVRPREIGTPVDRLRALGYERDWTGAPLVSDDQLIAVLPQDLVVARSCGRYLVQIARFVDDELAHLYGIAPFYRARAPEDLVGALVAALAPHTSGAVTGRLIGFTDAEACFAHPIFHAAKRRNCDGDEDSVTLLLDALLNFSRAYLPESRGALMDKPLVLTTRLSATEVDKEAHHLDVGSRYPLGFYHAAARRAPAKDVEALFDTVGHRLDGPHPLDRYGFTHDTADLADGPVRSAYRDRRGMQELVEESVALMAQIRAVDAVEAIGRMLNTHFLPDVMGNLKSFATQRFRCKRCGTSYRRPPLAGRCGAPAGPGSRGRCDGELLPTVYEGMVRKYLGLSSSLVATPGIPPYVRQRVEILVQSLATLFPAPVEQTTLERFGEGPGRPGGAQPPNTGAPVAG